MISGIKLRLVCVRLFNIIAFALLWGWAYTCQILGQLYFSGISSSPSSPRPCLTVSTLVFASVRNRKESLEVCRFEFNSHVCTKGINPMPFTSWYAAYVMLMLPCCSCKIVLKQTLVWCQAVYFLSNSMAIFYDSFGEGPPEYIIEW
jgi:hypothetical protein